MDMTYYLNKAHHVFCAGRLPLVLMHNWKRMTELSWCLPGGTTATSCNLIPNVHNAEDEVKVLHYTDDSHRQYE